MSEKTPLFVQKSWNHLSFLQIVAVSLLFLSKAYTRGLLPKYITLI